MYMYCWLYLKYVLFNGLGTLRTHIHINIVRPLTGIQNGDESISQAGCGQLVKMLITLSQASVWLVEVFK